MMKAARYALLVAMAMAAVACGSTNPTSEADGAPEPWWLVDSPEYRLVSGGATRADIANSTGSRWSLSYETGSSGLQIQASERGSGYQALVEKFPQVGELEVDGLAAVLREAPTGSETASVSVAVAWTDGNLFLTFGGPSVSEAQAREFAVHLRRVPQSEWDAAIAAIPPMPVPSTDTTRLR